MTKKEQEKRDEAFEVLVSQISNLEDIVVMDKKFLKRKLFYTLDRNAETPDGTSSASVFEYVDDLFKQLDKITDNIREAVDALAKEK